MTTEIKKRLAHLNETQIKQFICDKFADDYSFNQALDLFVKTEQLKQDAVVTSSSAENSLKLDVSDIKFYAQNSEAIPELVKQVEVLLEKADGYNALRLLHEILLVHVDQWVDEIESYDDWYDDEPDDYFEDLAERVTEALLTGIISDPERESWQANLEQWDVQTSEYNDTYFESAILAAEHGWSFPHLAEILNGDRQYSLYDQGDDELAVRYFIQALLKVLKRQERYQEYLHLSLHEGQGFEYALMLIQLNEDDKALNYCLNSLSFYDDCFAIAQAFAAKEQFDNTFRLIEYALFTLQETSGNYLRISFLDWSYQQAVKHQQSALALNVATLTCKTHPSVANYQRVQEQAGEQWSEINSKLLSYLKKQRQNVSGVIEILLFIDQVQQAINFTNQQSYFSCSAYDEIIQRGISIDPDWVIKIAQKVIVPILDNGKAKYYESVIHWMAAIKSSYQQKQPAGQWSGYLEKIRKEHGRKYKLMGLMKEAGFF